MNYVVLYIVLGIAALWVWGEISKLLGSIRTYFDIKSKQKVPLEVRMENTAHVLLFIDKMIELYLLDKKALQITLKTPFKVIKMDNDIRELAEFVHKSLSPELFVLTDELAVMSEYIERYIVSASTIALMQCYKETNQYIAQMVQTPAE